MYHTITFLLLIIYSNVTFAQTEINNTVTDKHISISGTKISLVPPKSFELSSNFLGLFHAKTNSSIMISELPAGFNEISGSITKDALKRTGVEVSSIENVKVASLPGKLVTGTQKSQGFSFSKMILIFGSDQETIMINGVYPEGDEKSAQLVINSMNSIVYQSGKVLNPFSGIDFTVDTNATTLKHAKSVAAQLIFSADGKLPTLSEDKTVIIIGKSISKVAPDNYELYAKNRLKQYPMKVEKVESINEITIDGLKGYEIFAQTMEANRKEYLYQVMIFTEDSYYLMIMTTKNNSAETLQDAKKLFNTFKRN